MRRPLGLTLCFVLCPIVLGERDEDDDSSSLAPSATTMPDTHEESGLITKLGNQIAERLYSLMQEDGQDELSHNQSHVSVQHVYDGLEHKGKQFHTSKASGLDVFKVEKHDGRLHNGETVGLGASKAERHDAPLQNGETVGFDLLEAERHDGPLHTGDTFGLDVLKPEMHDGPLHNGDTVGLDVKLSRAERHDRPLHNVDTIEGLLDRLHEIDEALNSESAEERGRSQPQSAARGAYSRGVKQQLNHANRDVASPKHAESISVMRHEAQNHWHSERKDGALDDVAGDLLQMREALVHQEEMREYREKKVPDFETLDKEHVGSLSLERFRKASEHGLRSDAEEVIRKIDQNGSGKIDKAEYDKAVKDGLITSDLFSQAFRLPISMVWIMLLNLMYGLA